MHDEVKLISILEFGFVGFESRTGVARFELWLFSLNFEESKSYSGDVNKEKVFGLILSTVFDNY